MVLEGPDIEFTRECTAPKVINFPRYNTKCSGENEILQYVEYFV